MPIDRATATGSAPIVLGWSTTTTEAWRTSTDGALKDSPTATSSDA